MVKNVWTVSGLFGDLSEGASWWLPAFAYHWSTLYFQHWAPNWGIIIKTVGKEQSYVTKFCQRKVMLHHFPSEVTDIHQKAEGW